MRNIVAYVKEFIQEQWNPAYFAAVGGMMGVLFFLNYRFNLETSITSRLQHPAALTTFYFVFYSVPYFFAHAAYALCTKKFEILRQRRFWTLSLFCLTVLSIYIALHDLPKYVLNNYPSAFEIVTSELRRLVARCLSNVIPLALAGIPLVTYWRRVDESEMPLYGFTAKTINLRPYFLLLLLLAPLVVGASFTGDFQAAYPRYKFGFPDHVVGIEKGVLAGMFQLCYGSDFVFVEFFFRGFMILGFTRLLGTRAIIPMVVVYALIHFEKPLLEALSSIIGGLVLGVISYRTKSIYGGIILHLGIAYMMEIAGTLQMLMRQ
jgi:membrane protease YdiL (CAAX protease family)